MAVTRSPGLLPCPCPPTCCASWRVGDGCHVWCEEDDVIQASDSVASIHSVKSGPRTLRFPTPRPVWDMVSGETLRDNCEEITLTITAPETRILRTEPNVTLNDNTV